MCVYNARRQGGYMLVHHHCSALWGRLPASLVVTYEMSYEITCLSRFKLVRTHFYLLLGGDEVLNCLHGLSNGQLVY